MSKNKKQNHKNNKMLINMTDLLLNSKHKGHAEFKTGFYLTQKDRPRDKSYKKYFEE